MPMGINTGMLVIQFILVSSHTSQSWQIKNIAIQHDYAAKDYNTLWGHIGSFWPLKFPNREMLIAASSPASWSSSSFYCNKAWQNAHQTRKIQWNVSELKSLLQLLQKWLYTVSQKRPTIFFVHNFSKCWSIFEILSPLNSVRNWQ